MEINNLIQQMTLEEKAALCTGCSSWTTTAIERLNVPRLLCSDGPHGVRRFPDMMMMAGESFPATCFPTASCQAATWNEVLIEEMGQALAEECIALDVDINLGPGNNMKRTPLCGRNFEYYSEDPFLSGRLATYYINGVQSRGVGVSLKHFAVNNQEFQRASISAEVDERTLREIYLPSFEMAVKNAKPWSVMNAYNKVNGEHCSEHHELLTNILKKEWGFEGLVYSDWGAVHNKVAALQAGTDLEMPGPKPERTQEVIDAVRNGTLDEAVLNESVRRILTIAFRAAETPKGGQFDVTAHHVLARKIASEGMVLLKNNGLLPLQQPHRMAIIGRTAKEPHFQGRGSSFINPTQVDIPFDALQQLASDTDLTFAVGYPADLTFQQALIDEAVTNAQAAEVAILFMALPSAIESEGYDRPNMDLTPHQVSLIKAVTAVQPNTIVILNNGSAVAMTDWIHGTAAVLESWLMGQAGGSVIADILFGRINPSGKLTETFPLKLSDTPAHLNFPGEEGTVRYGEGMFIGYRYYDAREIPVLFPFGHGLSYTTFAYSNPRVSATTFKDTDGLTISVDVTNTGSMAGKEIVQLYVRDCESGLVRPVKELKGFAKVSLQAGETKTVTIALDFRAFAFYHPGYKQWITEDGQFDLLIGASAADIRFVETVTLQSTVALPSLLNERSTLREWLTDPRGKVVVAPLYEEIVEQLKQSSSDDTEPSDELGVDMLEFIMDMPLLSILHFQEAGLSDSPDSILNDLLTQLK